MTTGDYGIRQHTRKALELCAYLHWFNGADVHELTRQTGVSIPTVVGEGAGSANGQATSSHQ